MAEKVFVGMSGGVDSSVSAAMLCADGYEVEGLHLVLCDNDEKVTLPDAKKVAEALDIPFHSVDLRAEFKKYVVDYFVEEYKRGRTPNPCIICNQYIKFGLMLDKALELGADFIATGHYARVEKSDGEYILRASSSAKDQSYFLYRLSQYQLQHTMFPVDGFEKLDTRALATQYNLPVADKKDSQEICFVPNDDYAKFIFDYSGYTAAPGNFVDLEDNVIGTHNGIIHYTVGQRKGLGAFGKPMFVTKIDAENNKVVLAPDGFQQSGEFYVDNLNFISGKSLEKEIKANVKVRYRAKPEPASIIPISDDEALVIFDDPQRAITPGQSAVFYDGDIVLGGGFIK